MKTFSSSQPNCHFRKMASVAIISVISVISVVTLFAPDGVAVGQTPAAPSAPVGTRVAVIDISYIFKNHPGFKQSMEQMKKEVQAFEATLQEKGKQVQGLEQQIGQYKPTSPEYKNIEAQMFQMTAGIQTQATLKKKDFLEKEAAIYYQTYQEIVHAVAAICERHGFGLVVRFNSEPIDPAVRPSVLEGVNRAVVYQKNLNITFAVLERLKEQVAARPNPAGSGVPR